MRDIPAAVAMSLKLPDNLGHIEISHIRYVFKGLIATGLLLAIAGCGTTERTSIARETSRYDVVIYGGTSAGIAAAVQTARMGKRAVLIEPGRHLGGLTAGGLGATDIGNKGAIGGIAREFYERIASHYAPDSAWRQETRADYFTRRNAGRNLAEDPIATAKGIQAQSPQRCSEAGAAHHGGPDGKQEAICRQDVSRRYLRRGFDGKGWRELSPRTRGERCLR